MFTDWHGPINSWRPTITCGQASIGQSQHNEFALNRLYFALGSIPFAWAHLKLAGLALWPIGKIVVPA